jgi:hypothetical protein
MSTITAALALKNIDVYVGLALCHTFPVPFGMIDFIRTLAPNLCRISVWDVPTLTPAMN